MKELFYMWLKIFAVFVGIAFTVHGVMGIFHTDNVQLKKGDGNYAVGPEGNLKDNGKMLIEWFPSSIFVHPAPGQTVSIITTVTETNQVWPKPEVIVSNWQKSLTEVPTNLIYRSTWESSH